MRRFTLATVVIAGTLLAFGLHAQEVDPYAQDPASADSRDEADEIPSPTPSGVLDLDAIAEPEAAETDPEPAYGEPAPVESDVPADASPVAEGSGEGAPAVVPAEDTVEITVRLRTVGESFEEVPIADHPVQMHVVAQPHALLDSQFGRTDAEGNATFTVARAESAQAVARIRYEGGDHFSEEGVDLATAGESAETQITVVGRTDDESVLFVSNLMTIAELWEDYIAFTQVWILGVDQPVVFSNEPTEEEFEQRAFDPEEDWLAIRLPDGAEGVTVMQPPNAHVVDRTVYVPTTVAPAGSDERTGPNLIVRFSLESHGRSTVSWRQPLDMDVESASIVVPQMTDFSRHPRIDVDIEVPVCGEDQADGQMCFGEVALETESPMLRDGVEVRVARGGVGSRGDAIMVTTHGWPSRPPYAAVIASLVGFFALAFGGWLMWRELRSGQSTPDEEVERRIEALEGRRQELLEAAAALEDQLDEGEILERDYRVARDRIREQLGIIFRRLRELRTDDAPSPSQGEDAEPTAPGEPVS